MYTKARPGGGGRLQLLCVPLYAALSSADQMQAFAPTARNTRKVRLHLSGAQLMQAVQSCDAQPYSGVASTQPGYTADLTPALRAACGLRPDHRARRGSTAYH